MPRKHVLISGTGRCGTTFLVELLTHLGLDTGYRIGELESQKDQKARAGLEHDVRNENAPYVVKSPLFCDHADEVLGRDDIVIEHVFIPMRQLEAAAESRRRVVKSHRAGLPLHTRVMTAFKRPPRLAGGLWHTRSSKAGKQEEVLLLQLYRLLLALSDSNIPVTLMQYPRIVTDSQYLFDKLRPILADVAYEKFESVFKKTARPDLVSRFAGEDKT